MTSPDLPRVLDVTLDLPAIPPRRGGAERLPKRLKLWQIPSNWLCSVIGTCLSPADIQQVLKRSAIRFPDGAYDYEIHGYVVGEARSDGRVGREINKVLDQKYRAVLRKVADEPDEDGLRALWDHLCQRGLVAGAYWAVISQAHVPEWLKAHAFGEIHMLSHFMGGFNRQSAKELWQAECENRQLADKLASYRRRAQEDLAVRDHKIAELEQELQQTRNQLAGSDQRHARHNARSSASWQTRLDRGQRRLSGARARLRVTEQDNQRLTALVDALTDIAPPASPPRAAAEGDDEAASGVASGQCILYVGGRCHLLPHLRARAGALGPPAASRRRPRRGAAGAGEPSRSGRYRVLPDRLHQPSRLSQGQAPVPQAGQAVRAPAQQQCHLLCPRDRDLVAMSWCSVAARAPLLGMQHI